MINPIEGIHFETFVWHKRDWLTTNILQKQTQGYRDIDNTMK